MNRLPPPGWYPDAHTPGLERWWDGGRWSEVTRSASAAPGATQPQPAGPAHGSAPGSAPGPLPTWGSGPGPEPGPYGPPGPYAAPGSPGMPGAKATTTPDGARLASWGRRAAARIVDGLVVYVIAAVVGRKQIEELWRLIGDMIRKAVDAAEAGQTFDTRPYLEDGTINSLSLQLALIFVLVAMVYEVPFVALRGATPGKMLFGLRIRRWDSPELPSWASSFGRWFLGGALPFVGSFVGTIFLIVDVLFPLWDGRRQAIHDKAARTVVVRSR